MDERWVPFALRSRGSPPPAITILSVIANASDSLSRVVVNFSAAVDGATLDADWLTCVDTADVTLGMAEQIAPTSINFDTGYVGFPAAATWQLTRPQPIDLAPASGLIE